ncbi:hypothetical protein SCLCIDRAFT_764280 [Scleroderma citrinum Foug A]|uniref:Uncharacterized protein n=1 Tax=Scleroderma citrinum Foug A TaxID=1036808 RepID=A0A0C3DRI6_9AGAM|nr:hypothetical protein SCLCIDRAFT_764280 [Scleroderma citrinum Foug A]
MCCDATPCNAHLISELKHVQVAGLRHRARRVEEGTTGESHQLFVGAWEGNDRNGGADTSRNRPEQRAKQSLLRICMLLSSLIIPHRSRRNV